MTSTTSRTRASRRARERADGSDAKPNQRPRKHGRRQCRNADGRQRTEEGARRAVRIDHPEECKLFFAGLEPLSCDHVEELRERLRVNRRDLGSERANAEWVQGPLQDWLRRLETHTIDLDEANMAALAVGMNEVMSIRDALIMSLVVDASDCDDDMLMDIISPPHTDRVSHAVHDLLDMAFHDAAGPDRARCQSGLMMLNAMAKTVPESIRAQPLAVIAYVLWWVGDRRACSYALQSLELDGRCSLAAIVLKSLDCGMGPACCDTGIGYDACIGE